MGEIHHRGRERQIASERYHYVYSERKPTVAGPVGEEARRDATVWELCIWGGTGCVCRCAHKIYNRKACRTAMISQEAVPFRVFDGILVPTYICKLDQKIGMASSGAQCKWSEDFF